MTEFFFDIEADGLYHEWEPQKATKVDCLYAESRGRTASCAVIENSHDTYAEFSRAVRECPGTPLLIGHNIIDYDLPMLHKFCNAEFSLLPDHFNGVAVKFLDTMIMSKLMNPDRELPTGFADQWKPSYVGEKIPGPHSLEVWAYRLGMTKPKLVYGGSMDAPLQLKIAQCQADVAITKAVYDALTKEARSLNLDMKRPLQCEQAVRWIITQGAEHGVCLDTGLAEECIKDLDQRMAKLAGEVEPLLPPRNIPCSKVKNPPKAASRIRKNNTPSVHAEKYFKQITNTGTEDYPIWTIFHGTEQEMRLVDWPDDKPLQATEPMKISDSADVKVWLQEEHGWQPTMWNIKKEPDGSKTRTSPKFHSQGKMCENLEALADIVPVVHKIKDYLSYSNRRNVICSENGTGWLHHPRLALDKALPSDADTIGTGTFRFRHRVIVNIPRPSSLYGEQMRSMFRADEGKVLVGWDASSLEDRCKAHYVCNEKGGAEYVEKILNPEFDVHAENAENWVMERQKTKNGHYALQYMCRPPKLAEVLGIDLALAEMYWEDWWARNQPLRLFLDKLDAIADSYDGKWVPGIDGRLVPCRYKHSRGNSLFQSAGIIAMKYAMVWWYSQIRKQGIPAIQIIHYHDEAVAETTPEYADIVGELGVQSIRKAGEMLNFRVPLLSEYHVGDTWKDIH